MDLQQFIKQFAQQFEASDVDQISENTDYRLLDTWDSLTSMSVQVMIEDEYEVAVTPEELKNATSVLALFNLIKSRVNL